MSIKIQSIRGMHDILPGETGLWQKLETTLRDIIQSYGYQEIRMPLVEMTELFKRSIGEVTDIVEKEMYTFADRNGDSLTLRPEGTASCVRAGLQHGLFHNQQQRLWYMGPMFRHERPQKGRYRQFHQVGVETYGMEGPDIDAEIILMSSRFWKALGLEGVTLQLNSLGSQEARHAYRGILVEYLSRYQNDLDADSQRRLHTNPLRILDSKNPDVQAIVADAPQLADHLDAESRQHFEQLQDLLSGAGIAFEVNPSLVRGLDYYSRTVFEWVTDALGAQGTICAGGRYDALVEQLGGRMTPASGFALGLERIIALLEQTQQNCQNAPHVFLASMGEAAARQALLLAEKLRDQEPRLRVQVNCGGGSFKSQLKKADKSGALAALILGEDEVAGGNVVVKALQQQMEQKTVSQDDVLTEMRQIPGMPE